MRSESRILCSPVSGGGTPGGVRAGKRIKKNWLSKAAPRHPNLLLGRTAFDVLRNLRVVWAIAARELKQGSNYGQQDGGKNRLDGRLARGIHMGCHPVGGFSLSGKVAAGPRGLRRSRRRSSQCSLLLSLATPFHSILETDARALWSSFRFCWVGNMVIWRHQCSRISLVESPLVTAASDSAWNLV
jgi:hypothetical protein